MWGGQVWRGTAGTHAGAHTWLWPPGPLMKVASLLKMASSRTAPQRVQQLCVGGARSAAKVSARSPGAGKVSTHSRPLPCAQPGDAHEPVGFVLLHGHVAVARLAEGVPRRRRHGRPPSLPSQAGRSPGLSRCERALSSRRRSWWAADWRGEACVDKYGSRAHRGPFGIATTRWYRYRGTSAGAEPMELTALVLLISNCDWPIFDRR